MQSNRFILLLSHGKVVSVAFTRRQCAPGNLRLHNSNASERASVQVTSHPLSIKRAAQRPPSHPISSAAPLPPTRTIALRTARFSTSETYRPHLVPKLILSQKVGSSGCAISTGKDFMSL